MPKRNYLMLSMLFVLFTYVFGADTLRISTPYFQSPTELICPANMKPHNDTYKVDEIYDESIELKHYYPEMWRRALKTDWALEHFYVDSTEKIYLIDSNHRVIGSAKFSHFEEYEDGGVGRYAMTFIPEEKVIGRTEYYISPNTRKYFSDDIVLNKVSPAPDNLEPPIEGKKVYFKYSFAHIHENDTTKYFFFAGEELIPETIVEIDFSRVYRVHNDSVEMIYSSNDPNVIYTAAILPILHEGNPVFQLQVAKIATDSIYKANLVWNNGKYELQGSRIIFE